MYICSVKNFHVAVVALCLFPALAESAEFGAGVSAGLRYTDNAELKPDNKISDIVAMGEVRAGVADEEGPLFYDLGASARRETYLNDSFDDQVYYNLGLRSNWWMLEERFNWYLNNYYNQRAIDPLDADTPDNIQNSNVFRFGANIKFPISGRQEIRLTPQYDKYYYSQTNTDNQQYSLAADWGYQITRLTNIGVDLSGRIIEYDDTTLSDTTFTEASFIISGQRVHSTYSINLGVTTVRRDSVDQDGATVSREESGVTGNANLLVELSSRSTIEFLALSEVTDTSRVSAIDAPGNPNDVALATDVIRNSIAGVTYTREDATLNTEIRGTLRRIRYADNTDLDSLIQTVGAKLGFPITQLTSSGVFVNFNKNEREESERIDKRFDVGVDLNVIFTTNLVASFDVRYRTKESTNSLANYDEFSAAARLDYDF